MIATKTAMATLMLKGFGRRLTVARQAAGYVDAKQFAHDLGIEPPRYRKYERGDAWPPIDVIAAICDITEVSADFLIFGKDRRSR